jgi:molybdopterin molybdotransferase
MTGAPLPAAGDAVLMVEHATVQGEVLTAHRALRLGENIVVRGSEARVGDTLLVPGQRIDAATVAVAANCGLAEMRVFAKPAVGILATGDELVEVGGGDLEPWQIYNSNSHALAALVEASGGVAHRLPIARDTREELEARIAQVGQFDLLLLSGGVSMGKYDLVEQVLAERGAEFFFTGVKIQPGKPVVFGRMPKAGSRGWTYFFGLPGNPVSTEVCFHLFAATMLRALAGRAEIEPQFVAGVAAEAFEGKPGITRLLPARLESSFRETTVRPVAWQGSGDTAANARANCYCVVDEGGVSMGSVVRVLLR